MRRPLKPFVTEYKAANRRPKDGGSPLFGGDPDAQPESPRRETVARKPAEARAPSPRRGESKDAGWPGESARFNAPAEDSYEAALKAADALFAAPRVQEREPATPEPSADGDNGQGGGRILRAIEAEPEVDLAALEAEHAPKRRGRKPGSKNKPKVTAVSDEPAPAPYLAADSDDDEDAPSPPLPRPVATGALVLPAIVSRGDRRFAWVRTKLRPGEEWKRRLPKILW